MVELQSERLDAAFQALADPTRRGMMRRLAAREHSIGELAAPLPMSFAAASKHVRVLERAGLVRRTIKGRTHVCKLDPDPLVDIRDWLSFYERFWAVRLDKLETLLKAIDGDETLQGEAPKGENDG